MQVLRRYAPTAGEAPHPLGELLGSLKRSASGSSPRFNQFAHVQMVRPAVRNNLGRRLTLGPAAASACSARRALSLLRLRAAAAVDA